MVPTGAFLNIRPEDVSHWMLDQYLPTTTQTLVLKCSDASMQGKTMNGKRRNDRFCGHVPSDRSIQSESPTANSETAVEEDGGTRW